MSENGKLSKKVKLGYGAGEFGGSIFWITIAFWLMNFLTDEVGLSAGLAGLALMIGKIWDAFTDPAVGYLSDRTSTRWGRRRPWFLVGALPFGLAFFLMFTNLGIEGQTGKFIWATIAFLLLCTAYTLCNVPYNSLLPEISKDFDERSSLSAYKSVYAVFATLLGAGIAMPIISGFESRTTGFMAMGAIFGFLIFIAVLVPFFTVKEKAATPASKSQNIFKSNLDALKNKPFSIILATWFLNTCGFVLLTATLVYFFKYIYNDENLITGASVILLLTSMVFIPAAVKVSEKIGKKKTYIYGMSFFTIVILFFFLMGHLYGVNVVYVLMFFAGIGLSTHYVMPWAIVPDTVEYDYALTGIRREGVYYGLWTFIIKVAQAVSALLLGVVLDIFGYIPDVAQTETSLLGIRLLIGPLPALFFILGNVILAFYPIDKKRYDEIQERIKRMEAS